MSFLESGSAGQAMTGSPAQVLGFSKPSAGEWFFSGDYAGYPFGKNNASSNKYFFTGQLGQIYNPGTGYFDGTWMIIYFFIAPTFTSEVLDRDTGAVARTSWLAYNPYNPNVITQNYSLYDPNSQSARTSRLIWTFESDWSPITMAELDPTNPTAPGMAFVAKYGGAGSNDTRNGYSMRWKDAYSAGSWSITTGQELFAENAILDSDSTGVVATTTVRKDNTDVQNNPDGFQGPQPLFQLVAKDNLQVITLGDAGSVDTRTAFGRDTDFYPQISYPRRNQFIIPPPYDSYFPNDAGDIFAAHPADGGMFGFFQAFKS